MKVLILSNTLESALLHVGRQQATLLIFTARHDSKMCSTSAHGAERSMQLKLPDKAGQQCPALSFVVLPERHAEVDQPVVAACLAAVQRLRPAPLHAQRHVLTDACIHTSVQAHAGARQVIPE